MELLFERIERLRKNETCKKVNKRQKIIANRTMMYKNLRPADDEINFHPASGPETKIFFGFASF